MGTVIQREWSKTRKSGVLWSVVVSAGTSLPRQSHSLTKGKRERASEGPALSRECSRVSTPTLGRFGLTLRFSGPKVKATRIPEPADTRTLFLPTRRWVGNPNSPLLAFVLLIRFWGKRALTSSPTEVAPCFLGPQDRGFPAAWGQLAPATPGGVGEWWLLAQHK